MAQCAVDLLDKIELGTMEQARYTVFAGANSSVMVWFGMCRLISMHLIPQSDGVGRFKRRDNA